jgi:hypothetical protein
MKVCNYRRMGYSLVYAGNRLRNNVTASKLIVFMLK